MKTFVDRPGRPSYSENGSYPEEGLGSLAFQPGLTRPAARDVR